MIQFTSYSDEQLVALLQKGNENAFNELYTRFYRQVYAYAITLVKDVELTEDIVHEVFIRLWEKRAQINIVSSFSAYIFRSCHNKAIDVLKKIATDHERREQFFSCIHHMFTQAPPNTATYRFYDELFDEALDILPPQRRRVFELCRQSGKTYHEVAALLGISNSTVKDHMVKAQKALREFLCNKGEMNVPFFLLLLLQQGV